MKHHMTPHATHQMRRGRIQLTAILQTLAHPDQRAVQADGRQVAERRISSNELLRVVFKLRPHPVVITVLRVASPLSLSDEGRGEPACPELTARPS